MEKKCLSKTWALQVQFRFWMLQDILNLWVRVFACRAVAWAVPSLFPIPPCAQDGSQVAAVAGRSPRSLPSHEGWRFSVPISQVICKSQISPSRSKTPSFGRGMVPKLSKNRANPRSAGPFRVEHPAGGYKKLFETVEELSSPVTTHVTGWCGLPDLLLPSFCSRELVGHQSLEDLQGLEHRVGGKGPNKVAYLGVEEGQIGRGIFRHTNA